MGRFDGKSVIVTGAAVGIGRGIALAFGAEGALVTIADMAEASAAEVVDAIGSRGGRAQAIRTDVSRAADASAAVQQAVATFGRLDVLVNNAGIQSPESSVTLAELPEEAWDRVIDVNLKGPFLMSKYAIPEFQRVGGGVIVNIASVQGLQSAPRVPAYAASKGGLLSLTRNMALDYALDGIRVVAVCPGTIDTKAAWPVPPGAAVAPPSDPRSPMARYGRTSEIADAVMFLASPAASFITGEHLNVDGGFMAIGAWASPVATTDGTMPGVGRRGENGE